jgi:hypothetical protein
VTMRGLAALAALALMASPVSAQEAATPEENLDCAIWAANLTGSVEETSEDFAAFGMVMTWFIGLYEGQVGRPIGEPLEARARQLTDADFEAIGERCLARMAAFGERLTVLGDKLQASE